MKIKHLCIALLISAVIFSSVTTEAYAFDKSKKGGHHLSLEKKFFKKTMLVLSNEEELGLSDKQAKQIKELKVNTKKEIIKINSQIDLVALDIKVQMWEDAIDLEATNKLIGRKYSLKKKKAIAALEAYVALKALLTNEQTEKLKAIRKECKKKSQMMSHPMKQGKSY